MDELVKNNENRIAKFFENKTLLITGGSGFLGKVLIEKLLRSCTGLRKIFVLVRSKKGKTPHERLEEILNGPFFDLVKNQLGKEVLYEKLEAISGDVSLSNLGLSEKDRSRIVAEAEIIYHSAATVKFDEVFKTAVLINVRGPKLMLQLAKECKKLQAFVHLSTAYCHEDQEFLEEKTYAPCTDPHKVIEICESMTVVPDNIKKKIQGPHANTYTLTKALGESIIEEQMDSLPVVILRPAAVIPTLKDPIPGWTDNLNGPMGLLIGAGKGVIRTMYGNGDCFTDFVPADITVNALIVLVYDFVTNGTRKVYNLTASDEIKVTHQEILDLGKSVVTNEVPFNTMLWYPGGSLKNSRIHHYFELVLFQIIPAILLDGILVLLGIKPCFVRIQKKIIKGYDIFEYYVSRKWNFNKKNVITARETLNVKEKEIYQLECPHDFDIRSYLTDCVKGARRYMMKEPDHTLPMAKSRMKMMWLLDRLCKFLFVLGFLYLLYRNIFKSFLEQNNFV